MRIICLIAFVWLAAAGSLDCLKCHTCKCPPGQRGPAGPNGPPGPPGPRGPCANMTAVTNTSVCPAGGTRFSCNDSVSIVCNGVNGTQGLPGPTGPQGPAGPTGAPGDFVVTYQPGGTTAGTVFADFSALTAYIESVGTPVDRWTIQIDGSFTGGSPTIPSGTYVLPSSVSFIGLANSTDGISYPGSYPTLSGDSVFFVPPPLEVYWTNLPFVSFDNSPIVPLITVSTNQEIYVKITNCMFLGFSPDFAAVNGGTIKLEMYGLAAGFVAGSWILSVDGTSAASLGLFDHSAINSGTATVDPGGTLNIRFVDSAVIDSAYLATTGINFVRMSLASRIDGIASGTATLVAGVTPAISGVVTATTRITALYSNTTGTAEIGWLAALTSDRVIGPIGVGSFKITSLNSTNGIALGDTSIVEWHIVDTVN